MLLNVLTFKKKLVLSQFKQETVKRQFASMDTNCSGSCLKNQRHLLLEDRSGSSGKSPIFDLIDYSLNPAVYTFFIYSFMSLKCIFTVQSALGNVQVHKFQNSISHGPYMLSLESQINSGCRLETDFQLQ